MPEEPISAIFPTAADAGRAAAELHAAGLPTRFVTTRPSDAALHGPSLWSTLFGAGSLAEMIVQPPDGAADQVIEILDHHNPIDLDDTGDVPTA